MVISKWSEFQLASKKDEEEGHGGANGEAAWKKIVVAIILDGLGKRAYSSRVSMVVVPS